MSPSWLLPPPPFARVGAETESELDAAAASSHFDAFVVDFEVEPDAVADGSVVVPLHS